MSANSQKKGCAAKDRHLSCHSSLLPSLVKNNMSDIENVYKNSCKTAITSFSADYPLLAMVRCPFTTDKKAGITIAAVTMPAVSKDVDKFVFILIFNCYY
jgi:hypothetical protein